MKKGFNPKLLSTNIAQQIMDFDTIYYCTAFKESQSGLMQNNRLLVIQESDFSFFYTRQIPNSKFFDSGKSPIGKTKARITELTCVPGKDTRKLSVTVSKLGIRWNFWFESEGMREKWEALLSIMRNKAAEFHLSRKSRMSIGSKSTLSRSESARSITVSREPINLVSQDRQLHKISSHRLLPRCPTMNKKKSTANIQQLFEKQGIVNQLYEEQDECEKAQRREHNSYYYNKYNDNNQ